MTESKSPKYAVGDLVVGQLGWRTHTVLTESTEVQKLVPELYKERESTAVGVLGMPG